MTFSDRYNSSDSKKEREQEAKEYQEGTRKLYLSYNKIEDIKIFICKKLGKTHYEVETIENREGTTWLKDFKPYVMTFEKEEDAVIYFKAYLRESRKRFIDHSENEYGLRIGDYVTYQVGIMAEGKIWDKGPFEIIDLFIGGFGLACRLSNGSVHSIGHVNCKERYDEKKETELRERMKNYNYSPFGQVTNHIPFFDCSYGYSNRGGG